jgi:hypothetical protein
MRNRLEIGILRSAKHREERLVQPEPATTSDRLNRVAVLH